MHSEGKLEELYSFDVFDTLITRKTATPTGIFALMQKELESDERFADLPIYLKENFYNIRINAEIYLRSCLSNDLNSLSVTIDEIYLYISNLYCLSEIQKEFLLKKEIFIEKKNIIPIWENIYKLKEYYYNKKRVILVSDMYFSSCHIKEILLPFIDFVDDIKVFVSSETKCSKRTGDLYEYIKQDLKLNNIGKKWQHLGDNYHSDVLMAEKHCIKAIHFNFPVLESYEQKLLRNNENDLELQILIGQCRHLRMLTDNVKMNFGISFAGPFLTAYVQWILYNSIRKGITRLYFIARDGYILKEIADILINRYNYPITTKYIYGSRLAWRLPSLLKDREQYCQLMDAVAIDYSKILDYLKVTREELVKFIDFDCINLKFSKKNVVKIVDALKQNLKFLDYLYLKNQKDQKLLVKYLQQEIDFTDNNFALVDYTGSGVTNNSLAKLIGIFFKEKIKIFYMFINRSAPLENTDRYTYLYRKSALIIFELLSRASHGQTLGYLERDGLVIPVLENVDVRNFKDWQYENFLEGIKLFAQNNDIDITQDCILKFSKILLGVDDSLIENLANQPFSGAGKNEDGKEFAPAFTKKDAYQYLLFNKPLYTNAMHWSMYRTKLSVRKIIEFKNKYGSLRKFLIDIYFSNTQKEKMFYIQILGLRISLRSLIWRNL